MLTSCCKLQVKFPTLMFIKSITILGGGDSSAEQFITQYKLNVSIDGNSFLQLAKIDRVKEFAGNSDSVTPASHTFTTTLRARHVRLLVVDFRNAVSLRWMLTGCPAYSTYMYVINSIRMKCKP